VEVINMWKLEKLEILIKLKKDRNFNKYFTSKFWKIFPLRIHFNSNDNYDDNYNMNIFLHVGNLNTTIMMMISIKNFPQVDNLNKMMII